MSLSLMQPVLLICVLLCAPTAHGNGEIKPLTADSSEFLNNLFNWFLPEFERMRAFCHNKQFAVMTFSVLQGDGLVPHFTQNVDSISSPCSYVATVPQPQDRRWGRKVHTEIQLISVFNSLTNCESEFHPDTVYLFTFNSPCLQCAMALQQLARANPGTTFYIGYAQPFRNTLNQAEQYLREDNIYLGQVADVCPDRPSTSHDELKRKRSSTCTSISCQAAYRDDFRCGGTFLAPDGEVAQCNPDGESACCSNYGWCGNTARHCDCTGCVDYRPNYRRDYQCGNHLAPNGEVAKCNPNGERPCCSRYGWCGSTAEYCECDGCIDYTLASYRNDLRCGGTYLAPNGEVAKCNPDGESPCCSNFNWCGITADYCECDQCVDYRQPYCELWGLWGDCSQTCGGGIQYRYRSCVGGHDCCDSTTDSRQCNTDSCPSCFASDSMVRVKLLTNNGPLIQRKRIDELKVGDHVESYNRENNSATFSEVYFISHDGDTGNSSRLIKLIVGYDHGKELSLRLHAKHLVYSCQTRKTDNGASTGYKEDTCRHPPKNPMTADSVKVGDTLWVRNSASEFSPRRVTGIGESWSGVRHPMTLNHYIVVDDVLASVHMYDEGLYRQITAPIRIAYGISPSITDTVLVKKLVQIWDSVEDKYF